jgi:hypothetical protein
MTDLNTLERTAIEAVARRFSATWEESSDPNHASIMVAGKRIAVELTTLERRGAGQSNAAKRDFARPGLRFDKVATRLIEHLQASLREIVPAGITVLLTITAPIRLPSKTAASLGEKIQALLSRESPVRDKPRRDKPRRDTKDTIHGNRIQIRLLRVESQLAPKMIGFVHNSDSDPLLLFDMTDELLELISMQAGKRAPRLAGDRWLVLICAAGISCLDAYRYIYSQLRTPINFTKILMVFADGRVGTLTA